MKTNTYALAIAVAALTLIAGCEPPEIPEIEIPWPWFQDLDGDGFGDLNDFAPVFSVTDPSDGTTTYATVFNWADCDDANPEVHPDATEVLDDIDNDCDGWIDNVPFWYADTDLDGYGDPNENLQQHPQPEGYVKNHADCDDTDATIHPGASEVINGIDNNCDGEIDNAPFWYADTDEDGYGDPDVSTQHHMQPVGYVSDNTDCNDSNSTVYPTANDSADVLVLDYLDNDCDGKVDEEYEIGFKGPASGTVFWVDATGEHGLEAAPEDQDDGTGAEWGCYNQNIDATGKSYYAGASNTENILAAGCISYYSNEPIAAELASNYSLNGYDDWSLPSIWSLKLLMIRSDLVGGIEYNRDYWSSTQYVWANGPTSSHVGSNYCYRDPNYTACDSRSRRYLQKVRAVRAF